MDQRTVYIFPWAILINLGLSDTLSMLLPWSIIKRKRAALSHGTIYTTIALPKTTAVAEALAIASSYIDHTMSLS
ncbi:hypothetical protein HOY80DRAFT_1048935 [Tuber brumale]|nr:hypothetical protein HOY80DRAFT_1048935 [Tuber brumale]